MTTTLVPRTVLSEGVTKANDQFSVFQRPLFPIWSMGTAFITVSSGHNVESCIEFLRKSSIEISNITEVREFLIEHAHMLDGLYDLPEKLSKYFRDFNAKLDLFRDFDSEIGDSELVIGLYTQMSPEEANERLKQIYRDWIIPMGVNFSKLTISLNFSENHDF